MKKLVPFALLVVCVLWLGLSSKKPVEQAQATRPAVAQAPVAEKLVDDIPDRFSLTVGDKCRLENGVTHVIGSRSLVVHARLLQLIAAKDELGADRLFKADLARAIEPNTEALVISKGVAWFEVRVLSGKHKGESFFVLPSFVKHPPTEKELAEQARIDSAKEAARLRSLEDARREKLAAEAEAKRLADEERAEELLKAARRWHEGTLGNRDDAIAKEKLDELLRRFPDSRAAAEARKLFPAKK